MSVIRKWCFGLYVYGVLSGVVLAAGYEAQWTALLQDYVKPNQMKYGIRASLVDYRGLKADTRFDALLRTLAQYDTGQIRTQEDALAFWINVYNIAAVKMVVLHLPLNSIRDAGRNLYPVWNQKIIDVDGEQYSLSYIEHKILRPSGDPRIHFAIVCASMSCPDLMTEAYTPDKVNDQLTVATKGFLKNPTKGMVRQDGSLYVSTIFKWFKDDFMRFGGVPAFIKNFAHLDARDGKYRFLSYNWRLNQI